MPFFVHSLVTLPRNVEAKRGRSGLLLGKMGDYFKSPVHRANILALSEAGFELHSTCNSDCNFPAGANVVRAGRLSPSEFATYLRKMSFLLGFGDPIVSPSPLEALAAGAAFVQPATLHKSENWKNCQSRPGVVDLSSQHSALATLGQPYVYNYDPGNASTLVAAAESAYRHRFASFVPFAHRLEAAAAYVCSALIESESLCTCAHAHLDGHALDCRGSHYTMVNGGAWQQIDVPPVFTSVL